MKRRLMLISLIALFVLIGTFSVSAGECGGMVVCNCGDSLTSSRILNATDNLTDCSADGLIVGAENIVLDCNEYPITGLGEGEYKGVYSYENKVTIKNCIIEDFYWGIYNDGGDNVTFENNTISDIDTGIYGRTSIGGWINVNDNEIFNSYDGIVINSGYDGDIVYDNYVHDIDGYGISLSHVENANISENTVDNASFGIYLDSVYTADVYYNNLMNIHSSGGIFVQYSEDVAINGNNLSNLDNTGIFVQFSSEGISIIGNEIDSTSSEGIYLYDISYATISENTLTDCSQYAIYLESSSGMSSYNTLSDNHIVTSMPNERDIYGIYIYDDNNNITNNVVECGYNESADYDSYGIMIEDYEDIAENNALFGNEVYNCTYGLYAVDVAYFSADNEDYHHNDYGVYLEWVGVEEESIMPVIGNSRIYNNTHGVYVEMYSQVNIVDTNFTNNIGSEVPPPLTGLHVSSDSSVYLTNGNFDSNGDYGIYDEGPDSVYWTLTEDVYCTNNDIEIADGFILPFGGKIIADNCTVTLGGEELNLSGGQSGRYSEEFDESMNPEFGNSSYGITGEIHTESGTYTGDLIVNFYSENPGGSGFLLADFGLWINATLSPEPADLSWWILKIYYTDEDLAASGLDESELEIQFYNESDDTWIRELDQGVNEAENYVWVNLTHFSIFGIFGSEATEGDEGGTTGTGCSTEWTCTEWSLCVDGKQTRTCSKIYPNCAAFGEKPIEIQDCKGAEEPQLISDKEEKKKEIIETIAKNPLKTIAIVVVLVAILGLVAFFIIKKRK